MNPPAPDGTPVPIPLADPTPERVSACPVHFLWDGRGKGRALVRAGFLGFLLAAMLAFAGKLMRMDVATTAALVVVSGAGLVYLAGQMASALTKRRAIPAR